MFEKVNPSHPDKVADRIAGAIVDRAYTFESSNPRIAVEVLLGHGKCYIIIESSAKFKKKDIKEIVNQIVGEKVKIYINQVPQDEHLADNQKGKIRCGDNGIFKGTWITEEQEELCKVAKKIYDRYESDGKYIIDRQSSSLTICQSQAGARLSSIIDSMHQFTLYHVNINPLGYWDGGISVDSGATNRKLGSDMGDSVTGGGLHGKDLSKADVSVNIYCQLYAIAYNTTCYANCSIGDESVSFRDVNIGKSQQIPYSKMVEAARNYISFVGGFEKFAEWGLVCDKTIAYAKDLFKEEIEKEDSLKWKC